MHKSICSLSLFVNVPFANKAFYFAKHEAVINKKSSLSFINDDPLINKPGLSCICPLLIFETAAATLFIRKFASSVKVCTKSSIM